MAKSLWYTWSRLANLLQGDKYSCLFKLSFNTSWKPLYIWQDPEVSTPKLMRHFSLWRSDCVGCSWRSALKVQYNERGVVSMNKVLLVQAKLPKYGSPECTQTLNKHCGLSVTQELRRQRQGNPRECCPLPHTYINMHIYTSYTYEHTCTLYTWCTYTWAKKRWNVVQHVSLSVGGNSRGMEALTFLRPAKTKTWHSGSHEGMRTISCTDSCH